MSMNFPHPQDEIVTKKQVSLTNDLKNFPCFRCKGIAKIVFIGFIATITDKFF